MLDPGSLLKNIGPRLGSVLKNIVSPGMERELNQKIVKNIENKRQE